MNPSKHIIHIIIFFPDVNECNTFSNICGSGNNLCVNILSGGFYTCACDNGYMSNELDASNWELSCIGMYVYMHNYYNTYCV